MKNHHIQVIINEVIKQLLLVSMEELIDANTEKRVKLCVRSLIDAVDKNINNILS